MITQPRFTDRPAPDDTQPDDDPVARLRLQLDELQAYARQQWAARTDRVLLGIRRLALSAVVGVIGLVALAAWVITAVVLLLEGATGGLATVLEGRIWLAALIVGGVALAVVAVALSVAYRGWTRASKKRTTQKYEHRQREQRRQFGHNAHDRASGR